MRETLRALEQGSLSSSSTFAHSSSFLLYQTHHYNLSFSPSKAHSPFINLNLPPNNNNNNNNNNNKKKQQQHGFEWRFGFAKLSCGSIPNPLIPSHLQMADPSFKLLFVEMGVGYDQHGQDITSAAVKACKNAITSNSIPAFRTGALPGISWQQMKLKVKLGVPHSVQSALDIDKVKGVFPYGEIIDVEVVDGGLICSSGVALDALGDKNDDCYVVNAAVYVGY